MREKFYKTISEFAKGKNLKRIVEVFLTLPDILAYKPLGQVSEQAVFDFEECADVLFVARGEKSKEVLLNSKKQVKSAQVLVIEDNRIPVYSRPALMVKSMAQIRAIESVKLIADWMKNGIVPAQKSYIIEGREEDYQILT